MTGISLPGLPGDFYDITALRLSQRSSILRAHSHTIGEVILKVWPAGQGDADRRIFLAEVSLHQALSPDAAPHPSIVPFVAASDVDADPRWLATRAGGTPLATWLQGRRLTPGAALRLSRDILDGLSALHERGLVHGDLTPANILVHHGRASLCDLGMAQAAGAPVVTDQVGTPEYMAPELIERMGQRPDARCDVYAAGSILSELFEYVEDAQAIEHLLTTRAQSQRPYDRPRDASDLSRRLTRAARGIETPRRSHPGRAYLIGLVATVLVACAFVAFVLARGKPIFSANDAPTPSTISTMDFTIDAPPEGSAVTSPLTLSGRHDLEPDETLWTVTRRGSERYHVSLTSRLSLPPDRWSSTFTLGDGKCDEGHTFTVLMVALKSDDPLLERANTEAGRGAPILEYAALPKNFVVKASTKFTLNRYLDQRDYCDGSMSEEAPDAPAH